MGAQRLQRQVWSRLWSLHVPEPAAIGEIAYPAQVD
jgi:hypothetical protein